MGHQDEHGPMCQEPVEPKAVGLGEFDPGRAPEHVHQVVCQRPIRSPGQPLLIPRRQIRKGPRDLPARGPAIPDPGLPGHRGQTSQQAPGHGSWQELEQTGQTPDDEVEHPSPEQTNPIRQLQADPVGPVDLMVWGT